MKFVDPYSEVQHPKARKQARWPILVAVGVLVIAAVPCALYRWVVYSIEEKPPELSAEYQSSEAILVAEELAGQILADVPVDEDGLSIFDSRSWETEVCRSGWDDHISWDGFVSASIGYNFDYHDDDEAQRIELAQFIFDKLEGLGLEPTQEAQGDKDISVTAERDDGMQIRYSATTGLSISTDCVVQDSEVVYTPPHVRISPGGDSQGLEPGI